MLILALTALAWAAPPPASTGGLTDGGGLDRPDAELPAAPGADDANPIVNGRAATADEYPMSGGLVFQGDMDGPFGSGTGRSFVCSSTLIAPDVVMAAAHCVDETILGGGFGGTATNLEFRWSRELDLSGYDDPAGPWPADAVAAVDWVVPDEWSPDNMNDLTVGDPKYDISLLFLEAPLLDAPYALLVTEDEADQIAVGTEVDIVGWGIQDPIGLWESFSPPEEGHFGIKQIGTSVIADVGTYEFQVGAQSSDVRKCKGDSGGPTYLTADTDSSIATRLVGVTSRAADDTLCESKGGYDTRVDAYLSWVDAQMRAACESGVRSWCEEPGVLTPEWYDDTYGEKGVACGCSSDAGAAAGWLPALLGLLALRRRRA